jgi:hypothetical protein
VAKQQSDSEREQKLAENRKASGDAARKQLRIPAKKSRENPDQAVPRKPREATED